MNVKFIVSVIVLFVVTMALGMIVHGMLLGEQYAGLPNLYRDEQGQMDHFTWMIVAHVFMAIGITWVYRMGYEDGKPWLSFGVMGGSMQPQAHAQIIINLVDFDMNLQEAGDAARMRHGGSSQPTDEVMTDGGRVYLESGISQAVRKELEAMGHNVSDQRASMGGYQAIIRDDVRGVYFGASESRKDGQAAGY